MGKNSVIKGLCLLREQLSFYTELISPVRPENFGDAVAMVARVTIREVNAHIDSFHYQLPLGFVEVDEIQDKWIEEVYRYATQFANMDDSDGNSLSVVFQELGASLQRMCDYLGNPKDNDLFSFLNKILEDYRKSRKGLKLQREYVKWKHTLPQNRLQSELKKRIDREICELEKGINGCHADNIFDKERMTIVTEGMARFIYYNPQRFVGCDEVVNEELSHLLGFALIMEWIANDLVIEKKTLGDVTEELEVSSDERIKQAIETMMDEGVIKHSYDLAFVMLLMKETDGLPRFDSPNSFLTYISDLGIDDLPGEDSIKKKLSATFGKYPAWTFTDQKGKDATEAKRRNNVASRFLSLYRKGK